MPRPVFARHPKIGRKKANFRIKSRPVTEIVRDKWYPFGILKVKRGVNNRTKLRKGLKPGTVLILLTGPYRGRRVVYLKQLKHSGLLLVTGPFAINKVPLRRVSQRFVIITSTRLDVSKLTSINKIEDDFFVKPRLKKIMRLRHIKKIQKSNRKPKAKTTDEKKETSNEKKSNNRKKTQKTTKRDKTVDRQRKTTTTIKC